MIEREYLERMAADFAAQIREYENNAAAARGALQVVQHLIEKCEEGAILEVAPPLPMSDGKTQNGTPTVQSL
jgi:hypothetical protein